MLRGGALKSTSTGRWAHLVCAVSIPEVLLQDASSKEPIIATDIPRSRKKLVCVSCWPPLSDASLSSPAMLHVSVSPGRHDARPGSVCTVCT